MPRDQRLYMTFPIDFWMHPKIEPLSDAAFRVFVEMNGYSRMQLLDGRIPKAYADRKWRKRALGELCSNHPERPSLTVDGSDYVIWNYAEHQSTAADIEGLRAKRAAAGAAGGRSKALAKAKAKDKQTLANGKQILAETETETETETTSPNGEVSPRKRAHSIRSDFSINQRMREWAAEATPLVDIDAKLPEFIDYWTGVGKPMKDWESVWHNGMRKQQTFAERDRSQGRPLTRTEQNMVVVAEMEAKYGTQQKGISA